MTKKELSLSHERLLERLSYDRETGHFTFRTAGGSNRNRDVGRVAGFQDESLGYKRWRVPVDAVYFVGARLAWFYVTGKWPVNQIDHKDGNSLNNAFDNLREADNSQNARNQSKPKNNTSGWKGVNWHKRVGKWYASIGFNGKKISLGYYDDVKEAAEAYIFAALELHGDFARFE